MKRTGNQVDYGMRVYDPRVGRFMSVDPLTKQYPWYTPYQFSGNTPIGAIDLDGKEPASVITNNGRLSEPMIHLLNGVLDYKESFLRGIRFGWTNAKVQAKSGDEVASVRPGREEIVINRKFQDSYIGDSYPLFWLNTATHEVTHKDQVKSMGDAAYLKEFNQIMEGEAYLMGDGIEKFVRNNNYTNLFDERWSEKDRVGLADYIGVSLKLNNLNTKLSEQSKIVDLYKGQLRLLKEGKLPTDDVNATRNDLKARLSAADKSREQTKSQINENENKRQKLEHEYGKIINMQYN